MNHIALAILCCGILSWVGSSHLEAAEPETNWLLVDLEGKRHQPFASESTHAIVLIFISTDCPIANSYQPMLQRFNEEYSQRGIQFFMVHPRPATTAETAREHAREFEIQVPVLLDGKQVISRRVGATVTPQAFVFVRDRNKPVYQGRIDNRYAAYGKKRRVATTHELKDALEAVIAGETPSVSKTAAVGCIISYRKRDLSETGNSR